MIKQKVKRKLASRSAHEERGENLSNLRVGATNLKPRRSRVTWGDSQEQREQLHELRRETIVSAATYCFSRQGFHGTTMDDIARRLNVSKPALYYYVSNKEELLFQCFLAAMDMGMEGIRRAEQLDGGADEKLRVALEHYIFAITGRMKAGVVLLEERMLSPRLYREVVRRRDEYEHSVRRLVEEGVASGVFIPCIPKLMVFAILGAVNWIPRWYSSEGPLTAEQIASTFADYLVRGLCRVPNDEIRSPISALEVSLGSMQITKNNE